MAVEMGIIGTLQMLFMIHQEIFLRWIFTIIAYKNLAATVVMTKDMEVAIDMALLLLQLMDWRLIQVEMFMLLIIQIMLFINLRITYLCQRQLAEEEAQD